MRPAHHLPAAGPLDAGYCGLLRARSSSARHPAPRTHEPDNRPALSAHDRLRGCLKCVIVTAACRGIFPASWAQWLIQRGGLSDA